MENICAGCGKEIAIDHPRLGSGEHSICMGCEGKSITAFRVTCEGNHYIDRDINGVKLAIDCMEDDEVYTIARVKMPLAEYLSLPEFDGF